MTLEEFYEWKGDGDTRYQLLDGTPVAMEPPGAVHRVVVGNLAVIVGVRVRDLDFGILELGAGLLSPSNARSYYHADLAVSRRPVVRGDHAMENPVLIVEVVSSSSAAVDLGLKLPDYRLIDSLEEMVFVNSDTLYCEIHRRLDKDRWLSDILRALDARLVLETVGLNVPPKEVYRNVPLDV